MHVIRSTSRATPASCDGEGEAQFPYGTWTHCEAPPRVEYAVHAVVRAEEFPLLRPTPKVMPRFSLESAVAAVAQMDRYESYLARCGTR